MIPQRWPLHPPPLPGEVLSSWLERIARRYQLTLTALVERNLGMVGVEGAGPSLSRGSDLLDIDPPPGLLETLHERTGVPVAELRHMTFAGWTPWLLDTPDVDQADAFTTFVRQDSVLFDHSRVAERAPVDPWRPWLPPAEPGVRWRRTCPLCALRPEHGLLLMAQLPIMLSCPEHGCRLLPTYQAVQQYPGAPELEIVNASEAVTIMDRRTHEGVTTGRVTLPRRAVHVGVWFRLLRTVLDEVNTPTSYLRRMADKETLTRIWQGTGRPVRAGQLRWFPYEVLDWDRQEAMLEAAATAMLFSSQRIIHAGGTLGPLLSEEPDRPVRSDPELVTVWRLAVREHIAAVEAARDDRDASRQILHRLGGWCRTPEQFERTRTDLIKSGLREEHLPHWPGK